MISVTDVPGQGGRAHPARVDPWAARLRAMLLRENQVLGALERHRAAAPDALRAHYAVPVSLGERRLRLLEAALARHGEAGAAAAPAALVRKLGRLVGRLTAWGGARRVLASDIAGVRRLGDYYAAQYRADPPPDVARMLVGFLGELEAETCALMAEARRHSSR